MSSMYESEARDDFNRARKSAFFSQLFGLFAPEKQELPRIRRFAIPAMA